MKLYHIAIASSFLLFSACDVDKTEEGEAPELEIEAEAGELPEYDVDWANVEVDTRTKTVTVPKLVIVQEEEEVEVPYVDVSMPDGDDDMEERTVMVEAEVDGQMQNLSINGIYATENRMMVVATLEPTGEDLEGQKVRVSDQVVINVPSDLQIERYIVGTRPTGEFNNQFTYFDSEAALQEKIGDADRIYTR
ncbi:hypothetical protein AB9P05_21930 [Roseivirga sp. BDSF3-8]|uniref:hypothetical protein n=1 Tax=Roseivirga sp. BDSF3-8 TaxID=3241598 RepID=UPI003531DA6F